MKRSFAMLMLGSVVASSAATASAPPAPTVTTITLRPADEPRPALKYRLVPERSTLVPGNAAIFYHRAILFANQIRIEQSIASRQEGKPAPVSDDEQINRWNEGPIGAIPIEQARALLGTYEPTLKEVELGARRADCDWGFDGRTDGVALNISEIQQTRSLIRIVSLRARFAIREGKLDEAFHWIEIGIVLGRHVVEGPTLIQALVGAAIESVMARSVEEWIQAPGAPSLYWALADRPRPMIDLRRGFEGERYLLETEIPGLARLQKGVWGLDETREFADQLQSKLLMMWSGEKLPGTDLIVPSYLPATSRRIWIGTLCARAYPEARRALIASGRPEAEIDAMPVIQVASLHAYQELLKERDENYKWVNLPYWQSFGRFKQMPANTSDTKFTNPLYSMFLILNPALDSIRLASIRADRQYDAFQCIEAIRLHAYRKGSLPDSLDAITDAPTPIDVATGKPFVYERQGDVATLSAPIPPGAPNHPSYTLRYVLKLTR